jgi:SnoaL-like domain
MEHENLERLRPTLAEWERGNLTAGAELLSRDVKLSAYLPGGMVVSHGWEEIGRFVEEIYAQWAHYRIEVQELVALDDATVLMEGRQYGTGRASGIDTTQSLYIVFRLDDGLVTAMYWHPERDGALSEAGYDRSARQAPDS